MKCVMWNTYSETNSVKCILWSAYSKMKTLTWTRRYGPLRGPTSSSCRGLRPSAEAFFALQAKKELIINLFWPIFGNYWGPVVTWVTFSNNLSNFERNPKKSKNAKKNPKISKNFNKSKTPKKSKNPKKSFFLYKKKSKNP